MTSYDIYPSLTYFTQHNILKVYQCCHKAIPFCGWVVLHCVYISSVNQLGMTLCDPMDCSTPGLSITKSQSLLKCMSIESLMPSSHFILCHSLLLPSSIFPSIVCMYISHYVYPFKCQWTLRLFSYVGCFKWCRNKHRDEYVFSDYCIYVLWIDTQKCSR